MRLFDFDMKNICNDVVKAGRVDGHLRNECLFFSRFSAIYFP